MKMKSLLVTVKVGIVLVSGSDGTSPPTEATGLDLIHVDKKHESETNGLNINRANDLVLLFKTQETMNNIVHNQRSDPDWPNIKITVILALIHAKEQ